MESKVNYTLVGLFVIVMGAVLTAAVVWLTIGAEVKAYDRYQVFIKESVAGLNPKSVVKYRGVDVGQVASIKIDPQNPERVEILLDIEQGTPIRTDTRAVLTVQGITGLAYVELTGGSRDAPPLEPTADEPIPVIESGPSLVARLDEAFTKAVSTFDELMGPLQQAMSPENVATLRRTLAHLERITGDIESVTTAVAGRSDRIGQVLDGTIVALSDATEISSRLTPLLGRVSEGVVAVEEMTRTITQTSQALRQTVEDSRKEIRRVAQSTTPELNALLAELGQLADTLRSFVEELDRNPRMLLLGRPSGRPGPGE